MRLCVAVVVIVIVITPALADEPQPPWRFTTWLDLLDHWQTGITGLIALIAAIIAVWLERWKARREVGALRKSLGVELRLQILRAMSVSRDLRELSSTSDGPISAKMVEGYSRMPALMIYPANADKIGLLKGDASDVVFVYALLGGARDKLDRLATSYSTPDDIKPADVLSMADSLLSACRSARNVLPRLRTGNAFDDAQDKVLFEQIDHA